MKNIIYVGFAFTVLGLSTQSFAESFGVCDTLAKAAIKTKLAGQGNSQYSTPELLDSVRGVSSYQGTFVNSEDNRTVYEMDLNEKNCKIVAFRDLGET